MYHQTIRVWNLANGNPIKTIGEDIGPVTAVTFSNLTNSIRSAL
jgi:hypothetical protein